MDSLNHLKTNYRPRYFNREGQRQACDIQGENVLKYIQGCFETCAKEFKVCSPALSTWSSSSSIQDQGQLPSQSKDNEQPEHKINDVNNAFDTFTFLPSPDRRDTCSDENVFEDAEISSKSHTSSPDKDIDISLGSPALLIEEKSCERILHFEDEAYEMDLQNSRDVRESERYHSTKEVKECSVEEAKCSATSSSKNEISRSRVSLEAIACSFAQRNAANVEPEDECEFLIEESFGIPSASWISSSKKSPKQRKNCSKTISSQQKKRTRQHDVKIKNKRGSQKLVTPSPMNQTEMKSTNAAERNVDGLQNVSRNNEAVSPVDEKSLSISSTIQEGRQHGLSKDDTSVGINNRVSEVGSLTENRTSLLKQKQILQPVISTNCSSISKKTVKQTNSKAKPPIEMENKGSQEYVTAILVSEDSQGSQDSSMHSKDTISALKPICSGRSTAELSIRTPTKSLKRQNSQIITSSKKTLQAQRNNVTGSIVKITRRKNKVLDSDESFQSEHGDEQCNEVDENHYPSEIQRINHSGKKPHQKGRKAVLVALGGNNCGSASYQEDSSEHYLTEKGSNASIKQQKHNTHSSKYSCVPDINMNISGPVGSTESTSGQDMSSNWIDLSSEGESGDLMEDTDGLVSNSLKHKLVLPTNTPNVRRTKRMRIKPLEYWRGERVNYKTRPSGGFVIGGIISPEQKEPRKPKPRKTKKPVVELEDMLDNSVVSLKDPSQPAVVFDAASNQEILQECVRSGSSHLFAINNETVSIYKYLTTPSFSTGKMILKPLKEKGYQYSHTDTLVFHITHGKLLLTMYDQCYSLTIGDYFFIPPGNVYNIRNLLNKECVVLFTQLKGNRPQN